MLQTARASADRDYEITKKIVAQASMLLQLHLEHPGSWQSAQTGAGGLTRRRVDRVRSFIDQHLSESVRVSDLSSISGCSTSHFTRAFKRTFGTSPHAYLMGCRVRKAMEMMRSTEAPLAQIALNCGFSDQAHFSRTFRLVMGSPPSKWRRELS